MDLEHFLEERVGRVWKSERMFGQESGELETFIRVRFGRPIVLGQTFHARQ